MYLRDKYLLFHEGEAVWDGEPDENEIPDYNLKIPPWICQPYYRIPPEDHKKKLEECQKAAELCPRPKFFDSEGNAISKKAMKKLKRLERRKTTKIERHGEVCSGADCVNTRGQKCAFDFCKSCCRRKVYKETLNCSGHKLLIKDKNDKRKVSGVVEYENPNSNNNDEIQMMDDD